MQLIRYFSSLSLRKKIILVNLFLLFSVTFSAAVISILELQGFYKKKIIDNLSTVIDECEYLLLQSGITTQDEYAFLTGFAESAQVRLTLIDSTGVVIFDSKVPQDSLVRVENHLDRPEVRRSRSELTAYAERLSATVNHPFFYLARFYPGGISSPHGLAPFSYLRVAMDLNEVHFFYSELRKKIFIGSLAAVIIIASLTYWVSGRVTKPILELANTAALIKSGEFDIRFQPTSQDEIGELADVLNEMLKRLRQDFIELRKLQTVRSQFLANVSHELRTPIFSLQGYLETLLEKDDLGPERRKDFLNKAFRITMRLNLLLNDLIDISRIESGEMKLSFRHFKVHDWLEPLCQELQNKASAREVSLHYAPDKSAPDVGVIGDATRLTQVMSNLISNAIKYSRTGSEVVVGYRKEAKGVRLFVRDNGQGIPREHLERIFERFYRVDRERSRAVGGTGLGLAIVKHIVEAHGSTIHVRSDLNKGSEFWFVLKTS